MDETHDTNTSEESDGILTKSKSEQPKPKQSRPKTAKQMEAFNKMQSRRQEELAKNKKEKTIIKLKTLLQEDEVKSAVKPVKPVKEVELSESDDEEVIVIKKQKKTKKKTIIIEESDSEDEPIKPPKTVKDAFRSQQNKKSLITIHNKNTEFVNENPSRFFI